MPDTRLIWPATLHHIALTSGGPRTLADWYERSMGFAPATSYDDGWLLRGSERNLLIVPGEPGAVAFVGYACADDAQVDRICAHITDYGGSVEHFETPFFGATAFATTDLDGNVFVFGLPDEPGSGHDRLPGRLQHVVFTTERLPEQIAYYTGALGFRKSDIVVDENKTPTACFMRSDPEHHSLGLFRGPAAGLDHFCFESTCWNDIRDWGDHFAGQRIPIIWGAGRHGAGNNLFIFVEDPDGNRPEISAEIEQMTYEQEAREWLHEQRTLNLWGSAWMRS